MRRWTIGVLAGLAVLVLAAPAQAKGEASDVTVTNSTGGGPGVGGPGSGSGSNSGGGGSGGGTAAAVLAAPIHLTGRDAAPWLGDTGIFQESQAAPAASTLGPALDVRLAYSCGQNGGVINQQLFPYAEGGAVIHLMPGQQFCDGNLPSVWWNVGSQTMGILREAGLPATNPLAVKPATDGAAAAGSGAAAGDQGGTAGSKGTAGSAGTAGATATDRSSGSAPVLPIALGVAAVTAVLALAVTQRRRRTVAA